MADRFCKHCGTAHTTKSYPQHCDACSTTTWFSPSPVAVVLQPVRDGDRCGVAIGKRGINPMLGQWNLFAGFVDATDVSAEHAAAREFFEETGGIEINPDHLELNHTYGDGRVLLIFSHAIIPLQMADLERFQPNHECPEMRVAWEPEKLCFDSHTRALEAWFSRAQMVYMG